MQVILSVSDYLCSKLEISILNTNQLIFTALSEKVKPKSLNTI